MSLVFNMVGGGSGGGGGPSASDAILTVTAPAGSTVTAVKGGVTLTPTMWVQAADPTLDCALFVISPSLFDSQNAWTVTATRGTDTASDTVTISENKQYDVELYYTWYLYHQGDTCDSITGGWSATKTASGLNFGTSYITLTAGTTLVMAGTENKVDLMGKSTLYMSITASSSGNNARIGIASSRITSDSNYTANTMKGVSPGSDTLTRDVRAYQGLYYVLFSGWQATFNVIDIWGE